MYVDNLINTDIFFLNLLHNEEAYSSNFGKFWHLAVFDTDIFFLNLLHNEDAYSSNFGKFWHLAVFDFAYVFPYY